MKTHSRYTPALRFFSTLLMTVFMTMEASFAENNIADLKITSSSRAKEIRMSGDRVILPFVMVREFPFIEGSVSGVSGKFLFDTGAQDALSLNSHRIPIDNLVIAGKGIFGSGQSFESKRAPIVKDIRIADLHYEAATLVGAQDAIQLEGITPDFLGWFGYNAWDGYTLKMDYRKLQATFYRDSATTNYLAGERMIAELPFDTRRHPNIPVMSARLGSLEVTAAFDTGSYGYLYVDKETKKKLVADGTLKPNDGENDFSLTAFSLGGVSLPDIKSIRVDTDPFPASEATGLPLKNFFIIGYGFLREYKTVWDFPRKKFYVLENR